MTKKQKKVLIRIIATIILIIVAKFIPKNDAIDLLFQWPIYLVAYWVIGNDILLKAIKGIKNRQVFDENFLMAVATIGAILIAELEEAVDVMLFYQIGELFQSYAVGKSRKNITELMDIRPDYANIEQDGQLVEVDPDEVEVGTIIVVKPGEKLPIDGVVVEGQSMLNTSALTGESVPRSVKVGDEVISGCINLNGLIKVQTTKEFGESTVNKILDLVENASSLKSKSENFISRFACYYTPVVCYGALALAIVPPVVLLVLGETPNVFDWVYRALTFLVISCPCALVISIPLTFFAGIGGASKQGILVKGSNYLETLSEVKAIVFDKTGTLTKGVFEVVDILNEDTISKDELLQLAAYCESYSSHPIATSIIKAYGKEISKDRIKDISEIAGHGIKATIDDSVIYIGNSKLMDSQNIRYTKVDKTATLVYVAKENTYLGCIVISDVIKPEAKKAINNLHKAGIKSTIMLTGDNNDVALAVGRELGIKEVHSQLLPADKVNEIEKILAKWQNNGKVAFVGDGINDAPVLSRVDIGISMGALGSDAAIEASDVVLMNDDLLKLSQAVRISKKCLGIVYQNIYFAIGVKLLCLLLGALGYAGMWAAIFADVGVMVIAVINAIRALFVSKL